MDDLGSKQPRKVLVNGAEIIKARKAKGYERRFHLLDALKAHSPISYHTLNKYEHSPNPEGFAFVKKLQRLADFLEVDVERLIIRNRSLRTPPGPGPRRCVGTWKMLGEDILVPGHFDYPNGTMGFSATVVVRQEGDTIFAEGKDHDLDPVEFQGIVREDGNIVMGQYTVFNERKHVYGSIALQFLSCGNKLKGFVLGRETGQGSPFILNSVLFERVTDDSKVEEGSST